LLIHPSKRMIGHRGRNGEWWELYVSGNRFKSVVGGYHIYAAESVKLSFNHPVKVKVAFRKDGIDKDAKCMMMVDGAFAHYRVKRVAHVFDGLIDVNDPFVCVQGKDNSISKRGKIICEGDLLGCMCIVINEEDLLESDCMVDCRLDCEKTGNERWEEWTRTEIMENLSTGINLNSDQKRQVVECLFKNRCVLSRGDDDMGNARLPEFKIRLTDYTPIYQKPRRFSKPITDEIEAQCTELMKEGVIALSESME
jgi:hypothetical protein